MMFKQHNVLGSNNLARLFSLTDQGAQGVGNILATAALGRMLPIGQFGNIGVAIGIYYFVAGFHRSAVVLPYITEHAMHGTADEARRYHSDWWWFNVMMAFGLALVLAALAGGLAILQPWAPRLRWGIAPLLLGALITPPLLLAEQARRWLYKIDRADAAALVALIYAGVLVVAAVVLPHLLTGQIAAGMAWALAGLAATVLPLAVLRVGGFSLWRSLDCFARHRRFATWLSLTIIPYVFYSNATVVILIGICNGPLAAGVFTAARTLTNPAVSIVSAVDSIDKPRAARALATGGLAGLRDSVRRTRLLLIVVTGGYLAVIAAAAQPLLDAVFHHRYSGITLEVRVLAAAIFLFCLNQPSETMLIVLRASATMFATRTATAVLTVVLLVAGSGYGVTGMAIGIALAQAANLLFLLAGAAWVEHRQSARPVPA
jgi:O-antigen/teichoic acid export membrane protein